jgi:MFS transporter
MLPVVGQDLAQGETKYASLLMAGLIVVPQIVVAVLSPWVGFHSEKWGRKPLLLLGFGLEISQALLFAFSGNVPILLFAQLLGGISAAAVTVLTILVITDLTTGHRPLQLSARIHRYHDSYRRFDQHRRNRLYVRGSRPLGRFFDLGGGFRDSERVTVGGHAGDHTG